MKKLIKIGKFIIIGYFVADVLAWSYTGIGRFALESEYILSKHPNETVKNLVTYQFDMATEGWKQFFKMIRRA